ncbi:T9SS type A sorting domain-containing protein [Aridibaculum aurantiacum]|uniref:T9SS type A sorting domain-containing protein n=1 Tax=Aridibaculum aurantiacum TaxID=2810307 RepID=UPI001A973218|nr:T9SS type A sorting domain-containing protein [Aridibaculum aurantiacum]
MKKAILPSLAIAATLVSSTTHGQSNRAFAITGDTKGSYNWTAVREIDLATGEVIRTIYDPNNAIQPYDAVTKSAIEVANHERYSVKALPMVTGVAAAAFDGRSNRLYFTNMRADELRYFDLSTNENKVFFVRGMGMAGGNKYDEANVITRMAFASDGVGYGLTNDGNKLVRFTTDQKPQITDLGPLIDGKNNGKISVHSQCTSWGGDMVGDAYGNLYLISMRNHIFKINPETRVADYVGQVKGLPADFTSNGMVVNNEGEAVVSSAVLNSNYYRINMSTLEATPIHKKDEMVYNASDLANSNLLFQRTSSSEVITRNEVKGNNAVSVYPNPVATRFFNISFEKVPVGQYTIALTDVSGRLVFNRALSINVPGQVEKINLPRSAAGGMYLLKVTGADKQTVYSDKIVVQ